MNLTNKNIFERLKRKNRGNSRLVKAIDKLIKDIELSDWSSPDEIKQDRPDGDCVHSDGFYFFDINIHRTMLLVEFGDNNEATIVNNTFLYVNRGIGMAVFPIRFNCSPEITVIELKKK